jgi:hypothetical protein
MIHENYVNSKGRPEIIMDHLSQADLVETRMYAGDWELFQYFNMLGCILPACEINHTLSSNIRPGSTWTKYQNMCMRQKKINAISTKIPRKPLCLDSLLLIRSYLEKGVVEPFLEYDLEPSDVDVLNHLSPLRKIKAKELSSIKKECAARRANRKTSS